MIPQQAVGKCISHRLDMIGIKLQEIPVVPLLIEQVGAVIASIVDMIVFIRLKRIEAFHGQFSYAAP
jgi:hypothetical protein